MRPKPRQPRPADRRHPPAIRLTLSGGQVFVDWGWQGQGQFLDMCELQVDRVGGKGVVLLAYDTAPIPPTHKKTDRAIYRV